MKVGEGDTSRGIAQIGKMTATPLVAHNPEQMQMEDPEDETEEPQLSISTAVITLIISTAFVAACAEFMVCICLSPRSVPIFIKCDCSKLINLCRLNPSML